MYSTSSAIEDTSDVPRPVAIDPVDCGCTECLTGFYVPLRSATAEQLIAMFAGELDDHTSNFFTFTASTRTGTLTITAEYGELEWTVPLAEAFLLVRPRG